MRQQRGGGVLRRGLLGLALLLSPLAWAACDEGDDGVIAPPVTGTIQGAVSVEDRAVAGVSVELSNGETTTTDAGGGYSFAQVPAGAYTVSISGGPPDATFSSRSRAATISSAGQVVSADFDGSWVRTSAVSGEVTIDGSGAQGVEVTLSSEGLPAPTVVTDTGGGYAFEALRSLVYTVAVTGGAPAGVTFEPVEAEVTPDAGETVTVDFAGTSPPPPVSWALAPEAVSGEHVRGSSPCPQSMGTITVTNDGDVDFTWGATAQNGSLDISPNEGTLAPGASVTVEVFFTCGTTTSFSSTILFEAQSDEGDLEGEVDVSVTIT